ncbi:MAG TPA: D-alanine--D-alanine ligase [Candidatus Dormibacteraeota bacterium]|jgi:D-alanine-D-alanine ligase|nr:D-alanine--D-alanine ligase [Candidatus Dormibacteraeota bacterium]
MRVAVLCGGPSAEREVSIRSGAQVEEALIGRGHRVERIEADAGAWRRLSEGGFDVVFIALHGRLGEDGTVQGMCELLGLPYTGSGVLASALCIDKTKTNQLLATAGLCVPEFEELPREHSLRADLAERLVGIYGTPLVIKPVREGSTIGLTVAHDSDQAASGILQARRYDRRVMVQRFQTGTEITVAVLAMPEPSAMPTLEITYENETYDYDAKYTEGKSHHIIPARLPKEARQRAQAAALRAFEALGCDGMARVDIIVAEDGCPWVLEVNTVPGLTRLSLLPDAARAGGVGFAELCERLCEHGVARHRERVGPA